MLVTGSKLHVLLPIVRNYRSKVRIVHDSQRIVSIINFKACLAQTLNMKTLHTFADFFAVLQRHRGDSPALIDAGSGETIRYQELLQLVAQTAAYFKKTGVRKNTRVLLYDLPSSDWVRCFLALQLVQAVAVPIDGRVSLEMLSKVATSTSPQLLITPERISLDKLEWVAPAETRLPLSAKATKQFLKAALLRIRTGKHKHLSEIILSSGTWSQPKGITLTQENLMANLTAISSSFHLEQSARLLSILPLSHAYEQMCGLLVPLLRGATIIYLGTLTPSHLKTSLKKYQITHIVSVPRVLELLKRGIIAGVPSFLRPLLTTLINKSVSLPIKVRRRLFFFIHRKLAPTLTHFIVGGAACNPELDLFFQGLGYHTVVGYGLSETSPIISFCNEPSQRVKGSVGKLLPGFEHRFSAQHELLIKGSSVFWGYWPNQRRGDWFNTQDCGFINEHGDLVLTGRTKNLLVFGNGDKIFLEDIENVAQMYPGISEAAVLHHPDAKITSLILLVQADESFNEGSCRAFLDQQLPTAVNISRIINIAPASLARTHTLKLNRHLIWQAYSHVHQPNSRANAAS